MRIDIQKLDERIKKLQEIRKVAADPELATILLEFMSTDDVPAPPLAAKVEEITVPSPAVPDTRELMHDVISGNGPDTHDGLWSRRR